MKRIFLFVVTLATMCNIVCISCEKKQESGAQSNSLCGTSWKGIVSNTISAGSVEMTALIDFTTDSTANMTMDVSVNGSHAGRQTAALTYVFDGENGTFVDPSDGNVVDFAYDSKDVTLSYDLYLYLSGQRIGGTFVMSRLP